jgi:tetratricopeptide (TPR) repeat protein
VIVADDTSDRGRQAYEDGRAALQAGQTDVAIHHFEVSIAADPHFKTLELLGEAWLAKGEPAKAIVPLAAATTLNRQVRAPSLFAEAFLALGERPEAHRMAHMALRREAHNKKAWAVLQATSEAHDESCELE